MKNIGLSMIIALTALPVGAQQWGNDSTKATPVETRDTYVASKGAAYQLSDASQLAKAQEEQAQIDQVLPIVDHNAQVVTPSTIYYPYYYGGWGWDAWRLHKGLNINLNASVFSNFGSGYHHGTGFSQDASLMYVTTLSPKATLAVGGYMNHLTYTANNYVAAGVNALFSYQFDEHWSAYAYVQKAFTNDNARNAASNAAYGYPYAGYYGGYGIGASFLPYSPAYGANASRYMDRIGGGVTYQWGKNNQNSISINVEVDHMPRQRDTFYDTNHYDYPVR